MALDDAALAVAVGGDSGASADTGGSDSGFADTGDTGAADTGSTDQGTDNTADNQPQEFELDEAGEQKLDAEGNPIPKAAPKGKADFKSSYEKIKSSDPVAAEAYRKAHFGYQQYQQVFPTPQDARAAKDLFDTYGGAEGIEKINGEAQAFADEMDAFSKGDPAFIQRLSQEDPEGFAATAGPYLAALGKSNPEAYTSVLAPIIHATFKQAGLTDSIVSAGRVVDQIYTALEKAGNKEFLPYLQQALDSLNKAYGVTENYRELNDKHGTRELTDKEKSLQAKEQALNQRDAETFKQNVWKAQDTSIRGSIAKSVAQYYKVNAKMTQEQKETFESGVRDFVLRQMDSDQAFSKQYRALLKDGNIQKINTFFSNAFNKKVADAAKRTWNRYGFGNIPNQQKKAPATGTVNLTKRPKRDDIDWQATTDTMYMSGEAVLKGSKREVSWSWDAQ